MKTSLSNVVDNFAKVIHKVKWRICDYFLEYESFRKNLVKYKCLSCKKDYSIDEELKKRFKNTFSFSNSDIKKFIFLLRESVCSSEYIDKLERFSEISMPKKEEFYSNLNVEDITDVDYMQAKRVYKTLK